MSDAFYQKYRTSTLLRTCFSADIIININMLSNVRLLTVLTMHLLGLRPSMTHLYGTDVFIDVFLSNL